MSSGQHDAQAADFQGNKNQQLQLIQQLLSQRMQGNIWNHFSNIFATQNLQLLSFRLFTRLFIFIEVRRVFGALIKIKPKKEDLLYIEISNYILLFYSLFYSFAFLFIYFLLSDSVVCSCFVFCPVFSLCCFCVVRIAT